MLTRQYPASRPAKPLGQLCCPRTKLLAIAFLLLFATRALADSPSLVIQLPEKAKATAAVATAAGVKLDVQGVIDGSTVKFANILPDTAYDVRVTLADGTVLQGVDMNWYNEEPEKKDAGEMSDDDKSEVTKMVSDVRQFYDRSDIVMLKGNTDRAVALVREVRDSAFHSSKGGEVIWRIEIWYFKERHGGWERISQSNKVVRRERYASRKDYEAQTGKIRWVPALGGIKVAKDQPAQTVQVPPSALEPATQPAAKKE